MSTRALNEKKKIITIDNRFLFTPRIEKEVEMSGSLFSSLYLGAARSLREICETSREKDVPPDHGNLTDPECNPVIAFVGGRGSGKTSAMLSLLGAIQGNQHTFLTKGFTKIGDYNFVSLPIIDPTALTKSESLLGVIAAHMYKRIEKIQEEIFCGKKKEMQSKIEALAPQLRKLYDSLRLLYQERSAVLEESGGLERLSALSVGYNLREQFKKTLDYYLDVMAPSRDKPGEKNDHSFLVLAIDDLDMNAQMGYQICEEIRKYLTIPRVVVLFSVKMAQLQDAVQLTFVQEYKDAKDVFSLSDSFGGMAEKYLNKLFPINRRHVLPTFELGNMSEYTIRDSVMDPEKKQPDLKMINAILTLLYRKLGLILVPNQYNSHNLMPKTLRGTVHLYKLLISLESIFTGDVPLTYEKIKENENALTRNINNFWDQYLLNYIENIDKDFVDIKHLKNSIFQMLYRLRSEPWQSMNRLVVREIKKFLDEKNLLKEESSESLASIEDICSDQTLSANISLGDVLYMLERLEVLSDKPYAAEIATYVRTVYSLTMVRLFFAEGAPEKLRRFVVQLNNPDIQRLVRTNSEYDKRDWRIENMSIITRGQDITLKDYIDELNSRTFDDIIRDPLGWVIICYAWFGDPREFNLGLKKWRSHTWDRAYSDSISKMSDTSTIYITINYALFVINLLNISLFENAIKADYHKNIYDGDGDKAEDQIKYNLIIPIYSAEIVNDIVTMQKRRAAQGRKAIKTTGFFEMFSEFEDGLRIGIRELKTKNNIAFPLGCMPDYQNQAPKQIDDIRVKVKPGKATEKDRRDLDRLENELKESKRRQVKTLIYIINTVNKFSELDSELFKEIGRIRDTLSSRNENDYLEKYEYEGIIQLVNDIKAAIMENPNG